jgi:hypothetical protein
VTPYHYFTGARQHCVRSRQRGTALTLPPKYVSLASRSEYTAPLGTCMEADKLKAADAYLVLYGCINMTPLDLMASAINATSSASGKPCPIYHCAVEI